MTYYRNIILKITFLLFLVFGQASSNSLAANFDIAYHYSGVAKFKPESGSIDLQWQIELNDSAADNFTFVLRSSLHSINVTGESLASFSVSESELGEDFQQIDISVKPVEKNHSRAIRLTYQGILLPKPMSNLINQISAEAIELNVDSFWHPIDPRFNQLMTVELDIQIESDWLAVGAGELLKTDTGFVLTNNKPALDVSFALSKKYKISQMSGYTLYDLRDNKGGIEKLTSAASFCSSRLNEDFGQSNPLGHIHFTINNRPSSGYARGNYIALTDISDSPEDRLTQFICHEIAHHWSFRGKFDTEENWLNESFAEYIGMMMLRERFGEQSFTTRINQFRNQIKDKTLKPIWSSDITERPDYLVSYRKGPLALWKLEQKIGREPFKQFIILYMTKNTSSTEQLLAQLLSISDTKTVEWFTTLLAK